MGGVCVYRSTHSIVVSSILRDTNLFSSFFGLRDSRTVRDVKHSVKHSVKQTEEYPKALFIDRVLFHH